MASQMLQNWLHIHDLNLPFYRVPVVIYWIETKPLLLFSKWNHTWQFSLDFPASRFSWLACLLARSVLWQSSVYLWAASPDRTFNHILQQSSSKLEGKSKRKLLQVVSRVTCRSQRLQSRTKSICCPRCWRWMRCKGEQLVDCSVICHKALGKKELFNNSFMNVCAPPFSAHMPPSPSTNRIYILGSAEFAYQISATSMACNLELIS